MAQAAQAAGAAAIADADHMAHARRHNAKWRGWLTARQTEAGITVHPSVGNFILAQFPDTGAHTAEAALAALKTQGILVRGMTGYGLPACLRITVGTGEESRAVAEALAAFMKDAGA